MCDYCENRKPLYETAMSDGDDSNGCTLYLCTEKIRGPIKMRLFRMSPFHGDQDNYIGINYCPMCGKKLPEKARWDE